MQEIMVHCFQSVRYKLDKRLGYFDLLGFDFMLDENLNVSADHDKYWDVFGHFASQYFMLIYPCALHLGMAYRDKR